MPIYHKHGTSHAPFHPRSRAVQHFSLLQLSCVTLACQGHSAPCEVSHVCAQGRSCSPQSCVKITVIVVSLVFKRIIDTLAILNVYHSHFNRFPKPRLPWNWSILCLRSWIHSVSFCHRARGSAWSMREKEERCWREGWLWCFRILWKYSFLILSKQLE